MAGPRETRYPITSPATPMPGKPDIAREMVDVFSNPVFAFASTLQLITTDKHPEMAGYENGIYATVQDPDWIMVSTAPEREKAAIFETKGTGPYGRNLRVVVDYDAPTYTLGGTRGKITTAYPRDVRRYPDPQVGEVIYSKKKGMVK